MGYSDICFRIARGRARERACNDPCTIWVLPPFLLDWSFTSRHCLTQRKQPRSPIATEKHEQHKPPFRSKNPRIIAWKLNLEWEHLFRTFFTWFRRKKWPRPARNKNERETEQTAYWAHNYSSPVVQHENWNKACLWIISALKTSLKWSQITLCILTNVLTPISERFCPNFEQIKIPWWPVGNRGQFSNMSGLTHLTCVNTQIVQGPLPISFPELRSPWPAVGKRELWEHSFQACAIDTIHADCALRTHAQ